jgi:hypothetical protein
MKIVVFLRRYRNPVLKAIGVLDLRLFQEMPAFSPLSPSMPISYRHHNPGRVS